MRDDMLGMICVLFCVLFTGGCVAELDPSPDRGADRAGGIDTGWSLDDSAPDAPTADELRARVSTCSVVAGGPYAPDGTRPATISICGFPGAMVWQADLDVDCDGKRT